MMRAMPEITDPRRAAGPARLRLADIRGASRLAVEATLGVTDIVEQLHHTILRRAPPLHAAGSAPPGPAGGITGLVYRGVRGVTRGVGQGLDLLLGPVATRLLPASPSAGDTAASRQREAVLAALNGVLGDHLHDSNNPLALPLLLRHAGRPLELRPESLAAALPQARSRVLLMVHGLCMNPWQLPPAEGKPGVDLGAALAADGDMSLLHLHYNSGLHVATNGRGLADKLHALQRAWPVPLRELVIVGHSMGGLVARSACLHAQQQGQGWLQRLSTLVFLGTPHHGAPLERGGRGVDLLLGASPYTAAFARLGQLRSAGITDLRHGRLRGDEAVPADRASRGTVPHQPTPLPAGVACYAVAGRLGRPGGLPAALREGAPGRLLGDGLVPLDSALGRHALPTQVLDFPPQHQIVIDGSDHFGLLNHPEVLAQLRARGVAAAAPRLLPHSG
jgi:alpha-beta hydrolase superfamily lysophospholipase